MSSRIFRASILALTCCLWACAGETPPPPAPATPAPTPPPPAQTNASSDTDNEPASDQAALLAQRTQQYARDMQKILARRATTQPSPVSWLTPNTPESNQPNSAANGNTADGNRPSANNANGPRSATASANLPQDSAEPQILPESADHLPGSTSIIPGASAPDASAADARIATIPTASPSNPAIAAPAASPAQTSSSQNPTSQSPPVLAAQQSTPASASALQLPPDALAAHPVVVPSAATGDALETKFARLASDYPHDLSNQLDYQLLRFVRDQHTPDISTVSQLSPEDQTILMTLLDGLTNFRNAVRADGNLMLTRKIDPLLEMSERLRAQSQLQIPKVTLCTRVDSYGVYTPLNSQRFVSGRINRAIVYCEVNNFATVPGTDNIWRTRLIEQIRLYTDGGRMAWPDKSNSQLFVDQSRARRHDFFIARLVELPDTLPPGKYLLKITLADAQSNRTTEATTPIEIVTPNPLPAAMPAGATQGPANPDELLPLQ